MAQSFGAQSTTDEVLAGVDLTGKRILVTGASAGLGVETCRVLAAHGASVVGAARDLEKAKRATEVVTGDFSLVQLDLASLASVRACTDALNAAGKAFDVVIANAGVMACPQGTTADGFETQFGTNHLGHFVFLNRVAPLIPSGGRIVVLSSAGHRFADIDLDDPNFERTPYVEFVAYGRSKTANALCAVGLDMRLKQRSVRATAVHPGAIRTELGRHMTPETQAQLMRPASGGSTIDLNTVAFKTIPQGAATSVWCAVVASPGDIGGRYCEDCHVAEASDDPNFRGGVRGYALDPVRADALWTLSEKLVGERFTY